MPGSPEDIPGAFLRSLAQVSADLHASLSLRDTCRAVADSARRLTHARSARLVGADILRQRLTIEAVSGEPTEHGDTGGFDMQVGIAGRVARTGRAMFVPDVSAERLHRPPLDAGGAGESGALVAVPVLADDSPLGVIEVFGLDESAPPAPAIIWLLEVVAHSAASALLNARRHHQLSLAARSSRTWTPPTVIVGHSAALREALAACAPACSRDSSVLITGEPGTGRKLIARHIHDNSQRRSGPLAIMRCSGLDAAALQNRLFSETPPGELRSAETGTLVLETIEELAPVCQASLLRAVRDRELAPPQSPRPAPCNVRIIVVTSADLAASCREGRFREDLLRELALTSVHLPPLRDRREDIPLLVEHFVHRFSPSKSSQAPSASEDAMAMLIGYRWPGNVRELEHLVERALLLSEGRTIEPRHLPADLAGRQPTVRLDDLRQTGLWGYEKALIVQALKDHAWNQTRAAEALRISRDNLRYRLRKYRIRKPR